MARRGRFGRSETGASDLSATIRSLIQQQAAQEEAVFMKAFYDGTEYNGKIPTMDDVIKFYERVANLSGIARGSEQWTFFEQKIGDANNFDIKRIYNSLITEFNLSGGENYGEIIDFITGRAMTSTDQGDLDTYQTGVKDITNAFLKYQGQALSRGELTAREYQRITLDALEVLEPGSKQYQSAMYDAFTYEWNALSTIWANRVKAGKVSESQFTKWAKGFATRVEAAGIGKKTELYSGIFATIASYSGGAGGGNNSPAAKRVNQAVVDLNSLLTLSASVTGIDLGKQTLSELADPGAATLKKLSDNPEALLLLADFLDQNPGFTNPTLTRLGIEDGDGLRTWVNDAVRNGETDAAIVAANGGTDNTDLWHNVAITNGSKTGLDEFSYASTKWAKDLANAAGNDILIAYYNQQWNNYLNKYDKDGKLLDSIYGVLPVSLGSDEYVALYQSELLASNGQGAPGAPTLSGIVNDTSIDWSLVNITKNNAADLIAGNALMNYDPKTGQYKTVGRQDATATTGSLKQVTFINLNGTIIPFTIAITGGKVLDEAGDTIAYVYQKPSGEDVIVSTRTGQVMTGVTLLESGNDFTIGEGVVEEVGAPPKIDAAALYREGRDNFTDPALIRQGLAALLDSGTINALNESEREQLQGEIDALSREADLIEADNLERTAKPDDIQTKIRVAQLRGEDSKLSSYQWFLDNADVVSFDPNGRPTLNYEAVRAKEQAGATTPPNAATQLGAGIGAVLGAPLGPLGMGAFSVVGGLLGGALQNRNIGMEFQAAVLNSRSPEEIARDRAFGMQLPTSESYTNRINQATQSSNVFFRNLATPTQPESPYPVARPSTTTVAVPPAPKVVAPVVPNVPIARTPFNPQDPEERRALLMTQKPVVGGKIPVNQTNASNRATGRTAL